MTPLRLIAIVIVGSIVLTVLSLIVGALLGALDHFLTGYVGAEDDWRERTHRRAPAGRS